MASNTRPLAPGPTGADPLEAARRADAAEQIEAVHKEAMSAQDEILSALEDFANYVAERGRGITVATPARRRLREDMEKVVLAFVRSAEPPAALDVRAEARVMEIVRQAMASGDTAVQAVRVDIAGAEEEGSLHVMDSGHKVADVESRYPRDAIDM